MKEPLILIVDDNSDSRLAIRAALRKKNYAFLEAQCAQEGIDIAIEHNPDLIIMDIMMPQIDGYEALRKIKENEILKKIPVLIITALSSMNEKIVALERGAKCLLGKPFNRTHLIEQVEALIGFNKNGSSVQEITEQKENLNKVLQRQRKELIRYFYTDALTGLANRSRLIKDMGDGKNLSLFLIDIDGFRDIVYFYGNEAADECLKYFTLKIKEFLEGENYAYYRISGDMFAVLVRDCRDAKEFKEIMQGFIEKMSKVKFHYQEHNIHFRFTLGASMFERELLLSAEKALKIAKGSNKAMLLYDEQSEEFHTYEQNIFWIKKIEEAIASDNIVPFYQPIVNNKTLKIEKYECLVRIVEDDGTIHAPVKFL